MNDFDSNKSERTAYAWGHDPSNGDPLQHWAIHQRIFADYLRAIPQHIIDVCVYDPPFEGRD